MELPISLQDKYVTEKQNTHWLAGMIGQDHEHPCVMDSNSTNDKAMQKKFSGSQIIDLKNMGR